MGRFDNYSKDIKRISEQQDHLLRNGVACVDTVFGKTGSKRIMRDSR
jgi:hypothetical protein